MAEEAKKPIHLGLMPPLSGLVSMYGEEITRAAEIACQEVNDAGGVLGRPLKLIIEDDGSLPESAVAAANKLIKKHKCVALVGNLLSNSRIAVAYRVAEPNKTPLLNFSFYEGSISSRYFFHFAALPNQQIDQMIPYMKERFGGRMYFAGNNYEWPRGSIHAAKLALNKCAGEIVGEEYCSIGISELELDQLLNSVEKSGAHVFVPFFAGEDQVKLLNEFTKRGLKNKMAVVMGHYDEVMASQLAPDVRKDFFSSNTYFMNVPTHENSEFLKKLEKYPGVSGLWPSGNGMVTNFGEGAYLCVKAFADAANKAKSLNSEVLVSVLESLKIAAPQGQVEMDRHTHHSRVNTYLTSCQEDGSFKVIKSFGSMAPKIPDRYSHLQIHTKSQSDEDLRLQSRIMEQLTEAVILIDSTTNKIIFTNPGFDRMYGYEHGELLGLDVNILSSKEEIITTNFSDINKVLYRKGIWKGEMLSQRKDGTPFWCSVSVTAFTHANYGEVWLAVQKDINDLYEKQEIINKQREDLVKHSKMSALGEMAGGIAHEINNPLAIIKSTAYQIKSRLQKGELENDFLNQRLEKIEKTVDRIDKIVRGLRTFSRQGDEDPMAVTSVSSIIEDTLELCRERFRNGGVELRVGTLSHLKVLCRATQLSQAIMNLLGNAFDAVSDLNEKWVELSVCEDNGFAYIGVIDSGMGIPKEVVDKMLQPFFTTKPVGKGTGLGLSITMGIIQSHNGELVYSKAKGHTCFYIKIPIAVEEIKAA